jgi:hypothetical protein
MAQQAMPAPDPNPLELKVVQGADFKEAWVFPFAVAGVTFKAQVRDPFSNNALVAEMDFEPDGVDDYRVFMSLPHTVTAALAVRQYQFDLQLESGGERSVVAQGTFEVEDGATEWG